MTKLQTPPKFTENSLLAESIASDACLLIELFAAHKLSTEHVYYDAAEKVLILASSFLADKAKQALNREGGRFWLETTTYKGLQGGYLSVHFGTRPAAANAA